MTQTGNLEGAMPAFTTETECRRWLASQPLANAAHLQGALLDQLNRLRHFAMAPGERFRILERLRASLHFSQNEAARQFSGRPLPLAPAEETALAGTLSIWRHLGANYVLCLEGCLDGDASVVTESGAVVQRTLATIVAEQFDLYRAQRQIPADLWRRLHATYLAAEQLGVTECVVPDPLHADQAQSTPRATYALSALLQAASLYELTARQQSQVRRWLQLWSRKIMVSTTAPAGKNTSLLIADLDADEPPSRQPPAGGNLRWIDAAELRRSIKKRIIALRGGMEPERLNLGADAVMPDCEQLLLHVYRHTRSRAVRREHGRFGVSGQLELTAGLDAIHALLAGHRSSRPAARGAEAPEPEVTRSPILPTSAAAPGQEHLASIWQVVDDSPGGLRVRRTPQELDKRLRIGQLVAVRSGAGHGISLGTVQWLQETGGGEIECGVGLMPGLARAVAIRDAAHPVGEPYRQALMLPGVPRLDARETLLLPCSWYQEGRKLEVFAGGRLPVKLTASVCQGPDHEQVEFQRL